MSDKEFRMLWPLDQQLRSEFPTGMYEGVQVRIEKIVGFELFNTRSYHNYETWSDGYRVVGPAEGVFPGWKDFAALAAEYGIAEEVAVDLWRSATNQPVSLQGLIHAEAEDLDDAVAKFLDRRRQVREILAEVPKSAAEAERRRTRLAVLGYYYDPATETAERTDP